MRFWYRPVFVVLLGHLCQAQDEAPPTASEPPLVAVSQADPIGVHPLFGAVVPLGVYRPMTNHQRVHLFIRQSFSTPNPWLRTSISASIAQMQGRQYSWGGGMEGYGHRYASQYATYVIRNSFLSLGAWGLGHDTRYVPARSTKVHGRIAHAVMQNFLTVNREGTPTVHIARILSGYGAGMIATQWQPHAKWSAQGIRAGNEQLIYGAVFNVGREFAPQINWLMKRILRR